MINISGYTESEVVNIIYNVANRLSYKYKFGYHSREDIVQQAALIAVKCLDGGDNGKKKISYDYSYPLENFLYVHIKNRLFNYRRDNYERLVRPCQSCDSFVNGECVAFNIDKLECKAYCGWYNRNQTKKNLMSPISMDIVRDEKEDNMHSQLMSMSHFIENKEISSYIDKYLNVKFRPDYIKLKFGHKLSKQKLKDLSVEIYEILASFANLADFESTENTEGVEDMENINSV